MATGPISSRPAAPSFRESVLAQPEHLEAAAAAARLTLAESDLGPLRDGVVVLSGIGASWHALAPTAQALRAAGRRVFAVPATELAETRASDIADAFVVVSQSGVSAEAVRAIERLADAFVVAVTAADTPFARTADAWIPLGQYREAPVASVSYTATLQSLGLLCDELLGIDRASEWAAVPELAARVLEDCDAEAADVADAFGAVRALDAIGGGTAVGSAGETALLAREALLLPATGLDTRQYLHGPIEAVDEVLGCVVFGAERELSLASALASYGAAVAVVTECEQPALDGVGSFRLPHAIELAAPILQILPVQLLVTHHARARGLDIGELRRSQPDTKVPRA
jgi:glucosamine--fructose-6-phosphate aminotransferase (isomerizing)